MRLEIDEGESNRWISAGGFEGWHLFVGFEIGPKTGNYEYMLDKVTDTTQ